MRIEQNVTTQDGQNVSKGLEQQRHGRDGKERERRSPGWASSGNQEKLVNQQETQVKRGRRGEIAVMTGDDKTGASGSDHSHRGPQDSGKPPSSGGGGGGGGDNNGPGRTGGDDFDPHIERGLRLLEGFANRDVPVDLRRAVTILAPEVRATIFATSEGISETHFKRLVEIDQFVGNLPDASRAYKVFNTLKVDLQLHLMNQTEPISTVLNRLASLQIPEMSLLARFDHQVQKVMLYLPIYLEGRLKDVNANPDRREYILKLKSWTQVVLFGGGGNTVAHSEGVAAGLDALYSSGPNNRDALLLLPPYAQEALLLACNRPWLSAQETREVIERIGLLRTIPTDQLHIYERMGKSVQLEIAASLAGNPESAKQKFAFLGQLSNAEVEALDQFAEQFPAIPMIAYIKERPQRLQILEAIASDCITKGINYISILRNLHAPVQDHVLDVMVGDAASGEKVAHISACFKNIIEGDPGAVFIHNAPVPSQLAIMEIAHDQVEVHEKLYRIQEVAADSRLLQMWNVLETTEYALIRHPQFKEVLQHFEDDKSRSGNFVGLIYPEVRIAFLKHSVEAQDALMALLPDLRRERLRAIADLSPQEQSWWYRQHAMVHLFLFQEQHEGNYFRRLDASDQ